MKLAKIFLLLIVLGLVLCPNASFAQQNDKGIAIIEEIGGRHNKVWTKEGIPDSELEDYEYEDDDVIDDITSVVLTQKHAVGTVKKTWARLKFRKDISSATFTVGYNSVVSIKKVAKENGKQVATLSLDKGTVHCKIDRSKGVPPQDFSVVTPTAVVGARGTEFIVSFNGKKTTVKVFEGVVKIDLLKNIGGIQTIERKAGEIATVASNKMTTGKLKSVKSEKRSASRQGISKISTDFAQNQIQVDQSPSTNTILTVVPNIVSGDPKAGAESTSSGGTGSTGTNLGSGGSPTPLEQVFDTKPPIARRPPRVPPTGTEIPGH